VNSEAFTIKLHEKERGLEVRYPERPTMETYEAYEKAVRAAISSLATKGSTASSIRRR
jgi:hypothetical protein